jgi:glutathione S-transferase
MKIAGTSLDPLFFWRDGHSVADAVEFATATAATLARSGNGAYVGHLGPRPARRFELYEREGCPFSRKVREALSILDLDAIVHPCPEGGTRFRQQVEDQLGQFEIPFLVDPNANVEITDSDVIVRHLFEHYGDGKVPLSLLPSAGANVTSKLATRIRGGRGEKAAPSREPTELLELYGYEASPYCRPVRETLTQLELPYILHNLARGSRKRDAFLELSGKMQFPYLLDPSRGIAMFESQAIVRYLNDTYGAATA